MLHPLLVYVRGGPDARAPRSSLLPMSLPTHVCIGWGEWRMEFCNHSKAVILSAAKDLSLGRATSRIQKNLSDIRWQGEYESRRDATPTLDISEKKYTGRATDRCRSGVPPRFVPVFAWLY